MSSGHAYIDPGTISIIFQGIVASIVAGAVTIKIYWYKIKSFFKKKKNKLDKGFFEYKNFIYFKKKIFFKLLALIYL